MHHAIVKQGGEGEGADEEGENGGRDENGNLMTCIVPLPSGWDEGEEEDVHSVLGG